VAHALHGYFGFGDIKVWYLFVVLYSVPLVMGGGRNWLDKLNGIVPVAPVLDIAQSLENPYLAETQMISKVPHPAKPDLRALANPIKINGKRLEQSVCPPLGADNAALVGQPSRQRRKAP